MGRLCSFSMWVRGPLLMAILLTGFVLASAAYDQPTPPPTPPPQEVVVPSPPLISLTDSTPADLEHQGDVLRGQKRYLDAVDYYEAAISKQPTSIRYNKLGMSYLFLQRDRQADKAFKHALQLDPQCAEALNNRGFVEQIEKNYGQASKFYEKALVIRPDAPTFHYNLASVYFARHKYQEAAQEYRAAYMLDPDIFERVSRMGILAQTSSPGDRAAFSFLVARMYAQAGDVDHSLEYLRKAMEEGFKNIKQIYTDSEFATLRTDKRFTELMEQKPQPLP